MPHRNRLRCLNLIAVGLLLFPLPASAIERDISGSLTGRLTVDNGPGPDAFGLGELPHLGKSQLWANLVFREVYKPYIEFVPELVFELSEVELTSANGDTLYAICSPTSFDADSEELIWDITFVGGTGRFVEAFGSATLTAHLPSEWRDYRDFNPHIPVEFELIDATLDY